MVLSENKARSLLKLIEAYPIKLYQIKISVSLFPNICKIQKVPKHVLHREEWSWLGLYAVVSSNEIDTSETTRYSRWKRQTVNVHSFAQGIWESLGFGLFFSLTQVTAKSMPCFSSLTFVFCCQMTSYLLFLLSFFGFCNAPPKIQNGTFCSISFAKQISNDKKSRSSVNDDCGSRK